MAAEELADGNIGGCPDGCTREPCQRFVQEQRGTLIGEDDGHVRKVGAVAVDDVLGDIVQKRFRHSCFFTLLLFCCYKHTTNSLVPDCAP